MWRQRARRRRWAARPRVTAPGVRSGSDLNSYTTSRDLTTSGSVVVAHPGDVAAARPSPQMGCAPARDGPGRALGLVQVRLQKLAGRPVARAGALRAAAANGGRVAGH